ncbi:universal stress protein [Actinoplanes sp. NBRC 14428]|uniref:Nucleotide-binding universal stress UspA family protein n=1 Tax=Pseudosporangium ferrugineum TaxID=439699 RepID=A0A2T0REW2_9ACTN|nr:universal stress protein [Pseudosporangium ferrugineum]PRY19640.1 nucleotide-binding universal stress UspA family protein [Pseudosporangium ferrugineum]BCJ50509.1 universal stress protein [Actinoplanes sp. NBRC 14428]
MIAPVIVGFDGSATARSAVHYGAREAQRRGCALQITHALGWPVILPPFHAPYDLHDQGQRAAMLDLLAKVAHEVREECTGLPVTTRLLDGPASSILVDASRNAQLLVVGHRGLGGFAGLLTGSVATQVAGHARSPVVIVRGDDHLSDDRPIVVGTDGSSGSRTAAEAAFTQARLRDVELILAYHSARRSSAGAIPTSTVPFWATVGDGAAGTHGISARYPDVKYRTEVVSGDSAVDALMDFSQRIAAGLLVIGSRGLGGFSGLLMGSTARSLIDHAPCPVMVVPPRNAS